MPVNYLGPVWLLVSALLIACVAMMQTNDKSLRIGLACTLALTAVSSYYLGRSHDNNILCLFPFIVLVLAFSLTVPLSDYLKGFSRIVLVGIVAWSCTCRFYSLTLAFESGQIHSIGYDDLLRHFKFTDPFAWSLTDIYLYHPHEPFEDLGAALSWFEDHHEAAPLILNELNIMSRSAAMVDWTGVNNMANFALLPSETVLKFIQNGAQTYHRAGWVVVDNLRPHDWVGAHQQDEWLSLFQLCYTITEERKFGGYTAYKLEPK